MHFHRSIMTYQKRKSIYLYSLHSFSSSSSTSSSDASPSSSTSSSRSDRMRSILSSFASICASCSEDAPEVLPAGAEKLFLGDSLPPKHSLQKTGLPPNGLNGT